MTKIRAAEGRASVAEEKSALLEYDYERLGKKTSSAISPVSKLTSSGDAPVNTQLEARDMERYRLAKREVAPDGDAVMGRLFDITRAIKMSAKQKKSTVIEKEQRRTIQAAQTLSAKDGISTSTSAQTCEVNKLKHSMMQSEATVNQANDRIECLQSEVDELRFVNRRLKRKAIVQDLMLALDKDWDFPMKEEWKVSGDYAQLSRDITKFATTLSQMPCGLEDLDAQENTYWLKLLEIAPVHVKSRSMTARIAI